MSSISTSNVTSGFIDLATFDEIEKYMYGGPDATAYFVRETRKSTWFTQVPVILSKASGTADFGQEWSATVSRAGDYMLQNWLRLTVSAVTPVAGLGPNQSIRWTRNLMHNIVRECAITFNDLVAARFDNYHLDFWAAFTVPAGKQNGYNNMIGNIPGLIYPVPNVNVTPPRNYLQQQTLNLPLPLFYGRDSGVALPTAALPYNDMRINFNFRDWTELLILSINDAAVTGAGTATQTQTGSVGVAASSAALLGGKAPTISQCNVWANYAIVSNDERKRMACAPRDILIEQVQTAPKQSFTPFIGYSPSYDIRFSHAIKVLFFAARNNTNKAEWSNYTSVSPVVTSTGSYAPLVDFNNYHQAADPIDNTSLVYENTARLSHMGSDYFSLVNPFFHAPVIPYQVGLHSYSYSLDFISLDPMGSTNYGKLTNVSIAPEPSNSANNAAASAPQATGGQGTASINQKYEFVITAVNNNIIRVSGGALGFPVL